MHEMTRGSPCDPLSRLALQYLLSRCVREFARPYASLRNVARNLGLVAFVISANSTVIRHELSRGLPMIIGLLRLHGPRHVQGHCEVVVGGNARSGEVATIDASSGWRVSGTAVALRACYEPQRRN